MSDSDKDKTRPLIAPIKYMSEEEARSMYCDPHELYKPRTFDPLDLLDPLLVSDSAREFVKAFHKQLVDHYVGGPPLIVTVDTNGPAASLTGAPGLLAVQTIDPRAWWRTLPASVVFSETELHKPVDEDGLRRLWEECEKSPLLPDRFLAAPWAYRTYRHAVTDRIKPKPNRKGWRNRSRFASYRRR